MKDRIGIWIDKRNAYIIRLNGEKGNLERMESSIPDFNPKGGHRSKKPWGPVDTIKEKAYLAKEQKATKDFFERIYKKITDVDQLFIFGPAQMKDELRKYLNQKHDFNPEYLKVEPADSMTENQMIARVKENLEPVN